MNFEFLSQEYFFLFIFIPIIIFFYYKKQSLGILFSFFSDVKKIYIRNTFTFYFKIIILFFILSFYILILANPNISSQEEITSKNWIDIVLVLDISTSMEAKDLSPTRIEKAKQVIIDFLSKQETNRLWLVVFAWKPFTSIPLTFDYNILKETVLNLNTNIINQNNSYLWWTAIWDAILMWETLFVKDEKNKDREKIIILLTDGDANTWVDPLLASLSSKEKNIKIYTIWIWSNEWSEISYYSWPFLKTQKISPLNDETLIKIANNTSWEYFRATDNQVFESIFKKLESLEKSFVEIEKQNNYSPNYYYFVSILLILLFIFIVLSLIKSEIKSNLD